MLRTVLAQTVVPMPWPLSLSAVDEQMSFLVVHAHGAHLWVIFLESVALEARFLLVCFAFVKFAHSLPGRFVRSAPAHRLWPTLSALRKGRRGGEIYVTFEKELDAVSPAISHLKL